MHIILREINLKIKYMYCVIQTLMQKYCSEHASNSRQMSAYVLISCARHKTPDTRT